MANTSQSGHAINVANFEIIVTDVTSYGTTYNPSKTSLQLTALNTLLTDAKNADSMVNEAESTLKLATGARDLAFKELSPLITKVNNALKASDVTKQVEESVLTIVRKLQGRRATPKLNGEEKKASEAAGKPVVNNSASQMGFESRIENFDKLVKLLSSVPQYTPNESYLNITGLTNTLNDIKAKNLAVKSAEVPLSNARITRNDLFYKADTGLVDIALDVKTYIKSVYGASSPQYKKISGIRFTKPR